MFNKIRKMIGILLIIQLMVASISISFASSAEKQTAPLGEFVISNPYNQVNISDFGIEKPMEYELDVIAENASYHCRRTFGTGLYDEVSNKTFVSWSGENMNIYVNDYDHDLEVWGTPQKIKTINMSGTYSYHNYPTMVQLPDGKIAIFYVIHTKDAYMLKSPLSNSIDGDWEATTISTDNHAYPMPIVSGNDVYLFYSKHLGKVYRAYSFIKSSDNGKTWTTPVEVIDTEKNNNKFDEVYAHGIYEENGKIYITWTMSGGPRGHNGQSKNVYLAYYDTNTKNVYNASNENLGKTINQVELSKVLVKEITPDSSGEYNQTHPVKNSAPIVSDEGTVVIGFNEYVGGKYTAKFGRFINDKWEFTTIVDNTMGFKDLIKNEDASFEVIYINDDGSNVIMEESRDLGRSWDVIHSEKIPYTNNADDSMYINYIENRNDISAVWGTIDYDNRNKNYIGEWPVLGLRQSTDNQPEVPEVPEENPIKEPVIVKQSNQQKNNPSKNIVDGDIGDDSRWSAKGFPQSVIIDYGETVDINGTQLWTYQDRAYKYKIWASDNIRDLNKESSDCLIVDQSKNRSNIQPITNRFPNVKARYVKIKVLGAHNYCGDWSSFNEFKILNSNDSNTDITVIQAEDGKLSNVKIMSDHKGYTGRGFIDYQLKKGASAEFKVNSDEGEYYLIFTYGLTRKNRKLKLEINDKTVDPTFNFLPNRSWNLWNERYVKVQLKDGENSIRLTSIGDEGPNIDKITIKPVNK